MSILSKIFIVLLVVLAIATAVTVPLIERDVQGPRELVPVLKDQIGTLELALSNQKNLSRSQITETTGQLAKTTADKIAAEENAKTLRKDNERLTDELGKANKKVDQALIERDYWSGVAKRREDDLEKVQRDRETIRAALDQLTRKYSDMNLKVTDVSTQRDFLLQQVKLLKEQNALLQNQLNNPNRSTGGQPGEGGTESVRQVATSGPPIKGRITAVAENQTMATIDVGANDGVEESMEFTVFRKGKFIGKLFITRVDAKTSVGRLDMVQERVQLDDRAWTRLSAN